MSPVQGGDPVVDEPQPEAPPGIHAWNTLGSADIFHHDWETEDQGGSTLGFRPAITWGREKDVTLALPLLMTRPDEGDTRFSGGLDVSVKLPVGGPGSVFSAGVLAQGMVEWGKDVDTGTSWGGGPFVACTPSFGPVLLSLGTLLAHTSPTEGDAFTEIVPAVNVGLLLSKALTLNLFAIHYRNLDQDLRDFDSTDLGGDLVWSAGTWSLSFGYKTIVGIDNLEFNEIYLGTNWFF